jgi:ketosteroid isomerase-like protein
MSQENVEVARQMIQARNRRDIDKMDELGAEDMEWAPASPAAVERAVYRGRAEIRQGLMAVWETWEVFRFEEHEIRDLGDSVLWLGTVHAKGTSSALELDQEFANHISVGNGKVTRAFAFLSWQDGLASAGLRE